VCHLVVLLLPAVSASSSALSLLRSHQLKHTSDSQECESSSLSSVAQHL
jgi:hypothetical protein